MLHESGYHGELFGTASLELCITTFCGKPETASLFEFHGDLIILDQGDIGSEEFRGDGEPSFYFDIDCIFDDILDCHLEIVACDDDFLVSSFDQDIFEYGCEIIGSCGMARSIDRLSENGGSNTEAHFNKL